MSNEYTIQVTDVCKDFRIYKDKSHTLKQKLLTRQRNRYELNHVLQHVSFSLKRGEVLGLIGHNGSGKSTMLKLLNRILYPDSGSIQIRGKVSSLIELGAGFHPDMTGRENIYINATIFGLTKAEIDARLEDIIRFSELEEFIDNPVRTYSSGMYMRLAFSVAINVNADVLLIDEILAVGDANFQKKCLDKLNEIKELGTTIVIVSHSMSQIEDICSRVIWIDRGHIREDGIPKPVCQKYLSEMQTRAQERHEKELEETGKKQMRPADQYPVSNITDQATYRSSRHGTMEARFVGINMYDDSGKKSPDLIYGKPATLCFMIDNPKALPLGVQFRIYDREHQLCCSFENLTYDESVSGKLFLRQITLQPGEYTLDAFLFALSSKTQAELLYYDRLENFLGLSVLTQQRTRNGFVVIESEWE